MRFAALLSFCLGFVLHAQGAIETQPAFEVFPTSVDLTTGRDRQSLVVRITEPTGVHRNVTAEAKFTVADPAKAKVENGVILPLADGETVLKVEFGGKTAEVPVKIAQAQVDPPVSFRRDVMPVFMKAGCNAGGCHGASRGKDGFMISLFGYDPEGDHFRLTRQMVGRRINLAIPEESMLITKNTGGAPHTGGKTFTKESEIAKTLLRWIEAGAPNDPPNEKGVPTAPECTSLELLPKSLVLEGPGQKFKMTVRAHYADGTDRDVTDLALFLSSNDSSAKLDADGTVLTGQRGEAFVMARFATHTVGAQVIVIPKGLEFTFPEIEERNFVDVLVDQKLRNLRMLPSETCTDEIFLRRASIDLNGLLPTS